MPAAGETIIAGRVPGERIATTISTSDSGTITTTETAVMTVVAAVVIGRIYRVSAFYRPNSSVAGDDIAVRIREDSTTGTQLQGLTYDLTIPTREPAYTMEAEYTADATENKTLMLTFIRTGGTGNVTNVAASTAPSYLYVDYIRG